MASVGCCEPRFNVAPLFSHRALRQEPSAQPSYSTQGSIPRDRIPPLDVSPVERATQREHEQTVHSDPLIQGRGLAANPLRQTPVQTKHHVRSEPLDLCEIVDRTTNVIDQKRDEDDFVFPLANPGSLEICALPEPKSSPLERLIQPNRAARRRKTIPVQDHFPPLGVRQQHATEGRSILLGQRVDEPQQGGGIHQQVIPRRQPRGHGQIIATHCDRARQDDAEPASIRGTEVRTDAHSAVTVRDSHSQPGAVRSGK